MGMEIELSRLQAGGGNVRQSEAGWRLELPAAKQRVYRLAQLDDYAGLPRNRLKHAPPWGFQVRARVSEQQLPGTWGFGLWNDPFGLSLGFGTGNPARLPALPQTAWFMFASPPNWLSLRDDPEMVPANGFFAGTFRSPQVSSWLLAPALLALPLCTIRPVSRAFRRAAARIAQQAAAPIKADVTQWHQYSMQWTQGNCKFSVDGQEILCSASSPRPPLGIVLWIDNQYAAWTPAGRLGYGMLPGTAAWLDIADLAIQTG